MLIPYYALAFLHATTAIGYIYGYLQRNPDLYGKLGFAFWSRYSGCVLFTRRYLKQ